MIVRGRPGDIAVCLSTPPFVALLGRLAQLRGQQFVYKVEDLYPDIAVALGAVRSPALTRVMSALSSHLLRAADAVVVLDERMGDEVRKRRGDADGLEVIPNWADQDAIHPMATTDSALRASLGLGDDTLVFGYSGNFGQAHQFDALLEAAARLEDAGEPAHFLFTGAGSRRAEIEAAAARLGNVTLLGYQPREALSDTLGASDVHIVSLRPEAEGLLYPSKYAGILAAGRPVLSLGDEDGSIALAVERDQSGWVAPHEPERIATVVSSLVLEQEAIRCAGRHARAAFEAELTRERCVGAWIRIIARLDRSKPHGS